MDLVESGNRFNVALDIDSSISADRVAHDWRIDSEKMCE